MKIFISWSGQASRAVAELLRKYLPCIVQELRPFMSKHDLGSGVRWTETLARELEDSNFGIVCLTPENRTEGWILFEAGALTKHVEGRACCLLLRGLAPADVTGPLAQFQHRTFSREDIHKLLWDINGLLTRPLDALSLDLIFDKWWPDLERDVLSALQSPGLPANSDTRRDPAELLDELILRVRNIEQSIARSGAPTKTHGMSQTMSKTIEAALREFSPAQRAVLKEFAVPAEPPVIDAQELENRFGKEEVDLLVKDGFLTRKASGLVAHHLMVEFLLQNPNAG